VDLDNDSPGHRSVSACLRCGRRDCRPSQRPVARPPHRPQQPCRHSRRAGSAWARAGSRASRCAAAGLHSAGQHFISRSFDRGGPATAVPAWPAARTPAGRSAPPGRGPLCRRIGRHYNPSHLKLHSTSLRPCCWRAWSFEANTSTSKRCRCVTRPGPIASSFVVDAPHSVAHVRVPHTCLAACLAPRGHTATAWSYGPVSASPQHGTPACVSCVNIVVVGCPHPPGASRRAGGQPKHRPSGLGRQRNRRRGRHSAAAVPAGA
jgi:hypothetical protein